MKKQYYKISSNNIRRIDKVEDGAYITVSFMQENMVPLKVASPIMHVPHEMIVEKTKDGLREYLTQTLIINVKDFDRDKHGLFYSENDFLCEDFVEHEKVDLDKLLTPITEDEINEMYYTNSKDKLIDIYRRLVIFADKAIDSKSEYYKKNKLR